MRKSYGPVEVIKGVDLDIADREFVVFVGPSGCGKSTLLRMIAGLEEITSGELMIDGKRVNRCRAGGPRPGDGVPDLRALSAHDGARRTWAFALRLARVPKAERDRKVEEAARILQLEPYLDRTPEGPVGRPAPARRDRPRDRAPAQGVPVRRAAVQPRRRAARADADRARRGCTRNSTRR